VCSGTKAYQLSMQSSAKIGETVTVSAYRSATHWLKHQLAQTRLVAMNPKSEVVLRGNFKRGKRWSTRQNKSHTRWINGATTTRRHKTFRYNNGSRSRKPSSPRRAHQLRCDEREFGCTTNLTIKQKENIGFRYYLRIYPLCVR
jgi:hypothetical protein